MGPLFWKIPGNEIKKCSERTLNSCDKTETDGCCGVVQCDFCLELELYGEDPIHSTDPAIFTGSGWTGSINGYSFYAYWERNIYTDECEFIVLFDGEEVFRDPAATAGVGVAGSPAAAAAATTTGPRPAGR